MAQGGVFDVHVTDLGLSKKDERAALAHGDTLARLQREVSGSAVSSLYNDAPIAPTVLDDPDTLRLFWQKVKRVHGMSLLPKIQRQWLPADESRGYDEGTTLWRYLGDWRRKESSLAAGNRGQEIKEHL
jgi:hypothetical protein